MIDEIKSFIYQYEGTAIGNEVKNMLNNNTDPEYICDYAGIPYEEDRETSYEL